MKQSENKLAFLAITSLMMLILITVLTLIIQ